MPKGTSSNPLAAFPAGGRIPVRVRVIDGRGFEKTVRLERDILRVGRDPANDLHLDHPDIAACHLIILREGSRFLLTDAGGGRGVHLNGEPVLKAEIRNGDEITLGADCPYRITFLTEGVRVVDREERKFRMVLEASRAISSSLVLDEVLHHVMDSVMELTKAGKGFLMLAEPDGKLTARVARNIEIEALNQSVIPASRTVIQQAMDTRRPVFLVNAGATDGTSPSPSASILRLKLETVMCAPLVSKERVIGVIYVDHQNRAVDVTNSDLDVLESLAGHAAVAIENARLTERLLLAERVTALGRMVSSIVHDLRAPLTAIRGAAQLIAMNAAAEGVPRKAQMIIGEADRMTGMTEEILDFCRGRMNLDASRVGLSGFVSRLVERFRDEMAARRIRFTADVKGEAAVTLDARRMERVFRNLVDNAVDAMPDGGDLTLRCVMSNDHAVLHLSDSGRGMTEEVCRRVFEPFFTQGKRNGTGLGMSIVQKVVEAHGGSVGVTSAPGKGTTVSILLPVAAAVPAAPPAETAGAGVARG